MNRLQQQLIRLGQRDYSLRQHISAVVDHLDDEGRDLHSIKQTLLVEGEDMSEEDLFSLLDDAFGLFLQDAPKIRRVSKFKYRYDPELDVENLRGSSEDRQATNTAMNAFLTFAGLAVEAEDLLEQFAIPYKDMLLDGGISLFQQFKGLSLQFGEVHEAFIGLPKDPVKDEMTRAKIQERLTAFTSTIDEVEELYEEFKETRRFVEGTL